jgi:hypothetical protein
LLYSFSPTSAVQSLGRTSADHFRLYWQDEQVLEPLL